MEFYPEISLFITLRWLDIVDILLVAALLYLVYDLIKGTAAVNIFLGILAVIVVWRVVKAAEMELLTEILGQFISVGVIALLIVFQPELRQFLLLIGSPGIVGRSKAGKRIFGWIEQMNVIHDKDIDELLDACSELAREKEGALIIIARKSQLTSYTETGEQLDSKISSRMLQNVFFKNSP
ncbi:MAG: diadenylate cyclase, partial [Bacteroidetes bacterium]|nr:diadenylate cyclase [Bacteroidota bacterium]